MSGVSWHKSSGKWCAYGNLNGVRRHLGLFDNKRIAQEAADRFKRDNHIAPTSKGNRRFDEMFAYKDGVLISIENSSKRKLGKPVGYVCNKTGYTRVRLKTGNYYVHRIIWELLKGPIPDKMQIDHINGNRSDNRIENLRLATQEENLKNKRLGSSNATGVMGVTINNGKYLARVNHKGKSIRLGLFDNLNDAVKARKEAEAKYGYHENHGRGV